MEGKAFTVITTLTLGALGLRSQDKTVTLKSDFNYSWKIKKTRNPNHLAELASAGIICFSSSVKELIKKDRSSNLFLFAEEEKNVTCFVFVIFF